MDDITKVSGDSTDVPEIDTTDDNDEGFSFDSDNEAEQTQEDSTEETHGTEDADGDSGREESETEPDEGGDEGLSEEEFLAQHNLPGKPKTVEEVLDSYKQLLKKLNEQPQQRQDKLPDTDQSQSQRYFPETPMTAHVEQLIKQGVYGSDPQNHEQARNSARVVDSALAPFIQRAELQNHALMRVISHVRDMNWKRFQYKHLVTRDRLDQILNTTGEFDYDVALQLEAVRDKSLLKEFAKREQQRGAEKARDKGGKLGRFSGIRRETKPTRSDKRIWSNFVDAEGGLDEGKLAKLKDPDFKFRNKIVDAFLADHEPKRK